MNIIVKFVSLTLFVSMALPALSSASEMSGNAPACYDNYGSTVSCPPDPVIGINNKKAGNGKTAIYKDNGDGTVTDLRNGWMWQKIGNATAETHLSSNQYCAELELANLSDWRMPYKDELKVIVDYGRSQNIINPVFSCQEGNYWTATPHKKDSGKYQTIGFFVADSNAYPSDTTHFVRCIHRVK